MRTEEGGQHCAHIVHIAAFIRLPGRLPPAHTSSYRGCCDPLSFSVSCVRLAQHRAHWAERMPPPRLDPARGGPPAATVNRALGLRPFAPALSRRVLVFSRLSYSSRLWILEANEQNVSLWCKCSLFSRRRIWRGRPSGGWRLRAGVSRDSSVPLVHGRLLFTSFEIPGSGRGRVARSPLREASEPRRSGTGVPPAQGLLAAPSKALHVELLSPHRLSVPVTALFLQAGGGRRLSCLQEASCVSRVLQEPFSALDSWPWAGFCWEAFSSLAWSLCRLTPSPPGTRESPDLSLINTCEMMIPKVQRVFFFIIHFAY